MNEKYPLALPPGTVLAGQYVIEEALGQGGFGITYRALDHKTGEKVAVKEFFPDSMATRTQTTVMPFTGERGESYEYGKTCFLQEAETLAQFIGNENIVRIHSYFEENGTAYFVMDFVEGISFDDYIKEKGGKISYEEAENVLIKIIDALSVVHSKGIVHRDVTPDNIYITKDGTVKLLDFGAARYSLGDKSRSLDVVLKHGFAPKEQYTRHGKQGPYTDIYTVGASFYFAITGKRPPDSIDRIEEDNLIPPSSLGVSIPRMKEDAILMAMSVQPAERFKSMAAFKQALLGETADAGNVVQPSVVEQRVFTAPAQGGVPVVTAGSMQQPVDYSQTIPAIQAVEAAQPKKKKSLLPLWIVLGLLALAGIITAIVLVVNSKNESSSRRDRDEEYEEEEESRRDEEDDEEEEEEEEEPVVQEPEEEEEPVVQVPEEEPETQVPQTQDTQVTVNDVGSFDTTTANNVANYGIMVGNSREQWYVHPSNGLAYWDSANGALNADSRAGIRSLNIVDNDRIVYVASNTAYVYYKSEGAAYPISELDEYAGSIYAIWANSEGAFFVTRTSEGRYLLNYMNWNTGITPYSYYVNGQWGVTIMGDYIYFISESERIVYKQEMSTFGTQPLDNSAQEILSLSDDEAFCLTAENGYLYLLGFDQDGYHYLVRVDAATGDMHTGTIDDGNSLSAINVCNGVIYYTTYDSNSGSSDLYSATFSSSGNLNYQWICSIEGNALGINVWSQNDEIWFFISDANNNLVVAWMNIGDYEICQYFE
ncbi:MAG: hypothetical protein E7285_03880 [Lachnospiraceae bacterium]|nr:hypothetical protein [Lachnospiraceae bacterium]